MSNRWQNIWSRIALTYRQKIFLLTALPLVLAVAAISIVVTIQSRQLAEGEIRALKFQLIEAKRAELKNYLSLARTAIGSIYGNAAPDDEEAKLAVTQILSAMIYGQEGFFFVYDYDGNNLVSPRQTFLIGKNWKGLQDVNGVPVVDTIIDTARSGGGYHTYDWAKPTTNANARMVTYVVGLQDWKWALGTGIFIDDVLSTVAAAEAETQARIHKTFVYIVLIAILALTAVFVAGVLLNLHERRLADVKLRALTERIIDTQEEERGRVARELHDSVSQLLIGIRYTLELARKRVVGGDTMASDSLDKGIAGLNDTIHEVRRISADLRPGILDDLGLGAALKSLIDEFSRRTKIETEFKTIVFRNLLDEDAKIALYRIAQEALTNTERHAKATHVSIDVFSHRNGATMRVQDNGVGLSDQKSNEAIGGLGLRNMQERLDQLNGTLKITSNASGTIIEASVPLNHLLSIKGNSTTEGRNLRKSA